MTTVFDFVTVACFLMMAGSFFMMTARQPRTLLHLLLVGIVFAIANQLGNNGYILLGSLLIVVGTGYAVITIRQE